MIACLVIREANSAADIKRTSLYLEGSRRRVTWPLVQKIFAAPIIVGAVGGVEDNDFDNLPII